CGPADPSPQGPLQPDGTVPAARATGSPQGPLQHVVMRCGPVLVGADGLDRTAVAQPTHGRVTGRGLCRDPAPATLLPPEHGVDELAALAEPVRLGDEPH